MCYILMGNQCVYILMENQCLYMLREQQCFDSAGASEYKNTAVPDYNTLMFHQH